MQLCNSTAEVKNVGGLEWEILENQRPKTCLPRVRGFEWEVDLNCEMILSLKNRVEGFFSIHKSEERMGDLFFLTCLYNTTSSGEVMN